MKKMHSLIERFLLSPVHPLMFAIYYIFRLYGINMPNVPFSNFIRPLLISVSAAGVLFLLFFVLVRNSIKASFMTSAFLFMFFFYYEGWKLLPLPQKGAWVTKFPIIWALLTLGIIIWIERSKGMDSNGNLTAGVNMVAFTLLMFPTIQGIQYVIVNQQSYTPQTAQIVDGKAPESPPDIYYIILDAYPRADVLDKHGYDSGEFIQALQDMGFYVAECSQSNYSQTSLSLTSSLNMDYLTTLSDQIRPENDDYYWIYKMLDENAVRTSLTNMGYKTISFASGFLWAEWMDTDIFIAPPEGPMTEFEIVVLLSSYARVLNDLGYINFTDIHAERYRARTQLILSSFDTLVNEPGPKFVFIHLIVPHAPFAFDEYGNPVDPNQFHGYEGYVTQVKFINKFILPGLKTMIDKSTTPPVIILQGDHGPLERELQMRILNAYYLPEGAEALYPGISPVNSFRIIFNTYFGANFPLLEDRSYYSDGKKYNFSLVPNTCP